MERSDYVRAIEVLCAARRTYPQFFVADSFHDTLAGLMDIEDELE
jgi:hypothetical protein